MAKADLTADALREILEYDPETGAFKWASGAKRSGAAGVVASTGHINIHFGNAKHKAHRLAWLYVHGAWPTGNIDHINGNPADNRISNLRDVPQRVNAENQRRAHARSSSGLMGVYAHQGRWAANIRVNKKLLWLGYFDTPEEAHQAYLTAKRKLHEGCTI